MVEPNRSDMPNSPIPEVQRDAQMGKRPVDPAADAELRDEKQTERQAPDNAGPGEAASE